MKRLLGAIMIVLGVITPLFASSEGTLSIYLFNQGTPLVNNEIRLDGKIDYSTDKDGNLRVELASGNHQVEVFAKNKQGSNLGYSKKQVVIKEGKNTQLIISFENEKEPNVSLETPDDNKENGVKKIDTTKLGMIQGVVLNEEKHQPVANARIFVKGTSIDSRSDTNGRFSFSIPAEQNISISIVHSEYSAKTFNNLVVAKDATIKQTVVLTPASVELEEFVVLAPKVSGSISSIMLEEKESQSITNILSSEEMSKKGDSDAATALKRVTGVTLVGGKNIYVRGLGDRYSNIEMNSMPIPSPDPTKRVVPLDIFPSGVIESMKVQKSGTPDVPASFGGGYVDIRTKHDVNENYLRVSMETKGNSNTGKNVDGYQGGGSDWTGFDDGYRAISTDILNNSQVVVGERMKAFTTDYFTKEQLSKFTQDYLSRNYDVTQKSLPMGGKGFVEGAYKLQLSDKHKLSFFGNYGYEQDHKFREESYARYEYNQATGELEVEPEQYGTLRNTTSKYKQSRLFNIGYNFDDVFKLQYTKLYTHNTDDVTRVVSGIMGSNDEDMSKYYLDWEERTLDVNQINGTFDYLLYDHPSTVTFGAEKATSKLNQPNNYQYTYRNEGEPYLDNRISNNISNKLESDDEVLAFFLTNRLNYEIFSPQDYFEMGVALSSKERISRQNKYYLRKISGSSIVDDLDMTGNIESIYNEYVRDDTPYDERSLVVSQLFQPSDYFDAEAEEQSFYMSAFMNPTEQIEMLIGFRKVSFEQIVYQYKEDRQNPDPTKRRLIQKIPESLNLDDIFPSLSLKYKIDEMNHIDTAISKTYIVPDLREFTDGEYFHPYEVATVVGNPELENTNIYSFDLKYSHFFSDTENIKFGLFYKLLDKPIEDVMLPSSSLPIYSYDNASSATLYGFEIDGRKELDFISPLLEGYFIGGNFSYTNSDVTLRKEQEAIYTTNHRQLQGLSQTVINLSLGYEASDRSAVFTYNEMGERIRKVGMIDDVERFPDIYEVPASVLDFVWMEKFTPSFSGQIKLQNLLDEETIWEQGGRITNRYKLGQSFSFGVTYKY
ncbi:MAG: carboxypeptidase-like regulatory domain-containing protein [Sulfuricurvum sp.]|nr:carboxypeptidase-like regulatory domain-containing protein [Sulfuricurvum sp.]